MMTPTRRLWLTLSLTIPLAAACDDERGEPAEACEGAKCDNAADDPDGEQAASCDSPMELVERAQDAVVKAEPDVFDKDRFGDDTGVTTLGDLDGDGVDDVVVMPGHGFSGSKVAQVVYLSRRGSCPNHYAGHFAASDAFAADAGESKGVRDILASEATVCGSVQQRYSFDGERYQPVGEEDVIDNSSAPELIKLVRETLVDEDPIAFKLDEFEDDNVDVAPIGDLDGDGTPDQLVFPGVQYAGANVEIAIVLSQELPCTVHFAGHIGGVDVAPNEDGERTEGVLDLVATNISGCNTVLTPLRFDGERYVEVAEEASEEKNPDC